MPIEMLLQGFENGIISWKDLVRVVGSNRIVVVIIGGCGTRGVTSKSENVSCDASPRTCWFVAHEAGIFHRQRGLSALLKPFACRALLTSRLSNYNLIVSCRR